MQATCAKEYRLNLQNPNGTAKCVRGRWKPLKPSCTLIPCSVPSTEHGSYSAITIDPQDEKLSTSPLNAFDEVQDGEVVEFSCDEGYNVQGPTQLKCHESSWAVAGLPECVPSPCSLPVINNAVYQVYIGTRLVIMSLIKKIERLFCRQGGYRAGLTIAHGSSVSVQCENPANNLPVQMGMCTRDKTNGCNCNTFKNSMIFRSSFSLCSG